MEAVLCQLLLRSRENIVEGTDVLEFIPSEMLKTATEYTIAVLRVISAISKDRLDRGIAQRSVPRRLMSSMLSGSLDGATKPAQPDHLPAIRSPVAIDQVKKNIPLNRRFR